MEIDTLTNPKMLNSNPNVVVIMGVTGSGKSRLAIDLASQFPIEIINADSMQLIDYITSRNHLPVIVGGTNYYIQALVSRFLLDDSLADTDESCLDESYDKQLHTQLIPEQENFSYSYDSLKNLDPVAANRIHPNDHRKQISSREDYGEQNGGKADSLRYNCCFISVDSSFPVIDKYVDQRVDQMLIQSGTQDGVENLKENMKSVLSTSGENPLKQLLQDAIDKVKLNTRRLVRRQKRRLIRLQTLFGWNIHYVDATECLSCFSEESWTANVVKPSIRIVKSYFDKDASFVTTNGTKGLTLIERDLQTQHICKACVNKVLRGGAVHMSGNNINKKGVIAKEFINLENPESLAR